MQYRKLGNTGLKVSEIGYGAWGIGNSGWQGAEDEESLRALHRAVDLGLTFIDTALVYGDGHSERLVGQVVRERSERIYVASKIPPKNMKWPAPSGIHVNDAFPAEHVIRCTEQSLSNLGLDTIDVQQFHVWSDEWVGQGDWLEAVLKLKEQGKIRSFGISVNDNEPTNVLELIETGLIDTVQVIYNLFEQIPEDELLPLCEKHQVGVIVRVPFDEGGLTGRIDTNTTFPEGDFRNHYFRGDRKEQVVERVQGIVRDMEIDLNDLPELALRYILSHPAVSTVIPGMRSLRNVERNCAVSDGRLLTGEQLQKLHRHRWVRNFYK
ncbi:aldo/keto reductase [Paenibacillus sp. CAA11]|uniref:aldo/keto reductase n=1 Tax=Paenibacillus sp. CAA11 TaxID=1532905 RepID=UPI000D3BEB34|nr:aldo/keto reductase [Paenibacillus sp. CAA11]AWB44507.1 aldo/keto reductase [Paenibacillus sp. CAA11]